MFKTSLTNTTIQEGVCSKHSFNREQYSVFIKLYFGYKVNTRHNSGHVWENHFIAYNKIPTEMMTFREQDTTISTIMLSTVSGHVISSVFSEESQENFWILNVKKGNISSQHVTYQRISVICAAIDAPSEHRRGPFPSLHKDGDLLACRSSNSNIQNGGTRKVSTLSQSHVVLPRFQ